jgi:hypothetical protein
MKRRRAQPKTTPPATSKTPRVVLIVPTLQTPAVASPEMKRRRAQPKTTPLATSKTPRVVLIVPTLQVTMTTRRRRVQRRRPTAPTAGVLRRWRTFRYRSWASRCLWEK